MTPASSVLEAAVVPSAEPLWLAARHGLMPRGFREVAFAIGLNEASDAVQARVPFSDPVLRTSVGSLVAGCASGYISQVPHNLSVCRLMDPAVPYRTHLATLSTKSFASLPQLVQRSVPVAWRPTAALAAAFLFPAGGLWRSVSIAGTFLIVNGFVLMLVGHTEKGHGNGFGAAARQLVGDDEEEDRYFR